MNDLLLLNVKDDFIKNAGDRPSLGTGYIASYLKKQGFDINVADMNMFNEKYLMQTLDMYIKQLNPYYIGISMTTPQYKEGNRIGRYLKQEYPHIQLIAGGPHVTAVNGNMSKIWDKVVIGEGEHVTQEILEGIYNQQRIIKGKKIKILDDYPMPYRIPSNMEKHSLNIDGKKATSLLTSRGCVYSCSFCSEPNLNKGYRTHSPERVINEMKELKYKHGIEGLIIYDDIFAINPHRVKQITKQMIKENLDMVYRATTRASDILRAPEILSLLKDSGCAELCLGVESGDDNILNINDKGMSVVENKRAIKMIKNAGIKVSSYMITGLPGMSRKSEERSLEFLKESEVDNASWYLLAPFPGTDLWNNSEKYRISIDKNAIIRDEWDVTQAKSSPEDVKCYFEYPNLRSHEIKEIWLNNLRKWGEFKSG